MCSSRRMRSARDEWTTLPDLNGHTGPDTGQARARSGSSCIRSSRTTRPTTATAPAPRPARRAPGRRRAAAATATSNGRSTSTPYAGTDVEVSISYASDDVVQLDGAFVDDIVVPGGDGTTSFEDDGDTAGRLGGAGRARGQRAERERLDRRHGRRRAADSGERSRRSSRASPRSSRSSRGCSGRYPFSAGGGIVDDLHGLGFALENQTRPIYAREWLHDPTDSGRRGRRPRDRPPVGRRQPGGGRWQDIWLNEGFASYAEWLWSEAEGLGDRAGDLRLLRRDPRRRPVLDRDDRRSRAGPHLRHRGLLPRRDDAARAAAGRRRRATSSASCGSGRSRARATTSPIDEFIALAERISGEQLDAFFSDLAVHAEKPAGIEPAARGAAVASSATARGGVLAAPHGEALTLSRRRRSGRACG